MSSPAHFLRIKNFLKEKFSERIDTTRFKGDTKSKESQFFTRAQIVQCLEGLCHYKIEDIEDLITDGKGDNGIDFVYVDEDSFTLYLGQSKWVNDGNSSISKNDFLNFQNGFFDLINLRFENFNDSIKSKNDQVSRCIGSTDYSIVGVFCHPGYHKVSSEVEEIIKNTLNKLNRVSAIYDLKCLDQKFLYQSIIQQQDGYSIDLVDLHLYNYGVHASPFKSVFGEIDIKKIAILWEKYGKSILNKNLRRFKGSTSVNEGIKHSIAKEQEHFWYYNNGITILCKEIKQYADSANENLFGRFDFIDSSVVNGGQTIGSIGEAYYYDKDIFKENKARVQIRFIEIDPDSDYIRKIARYNNTQNRIESKDFASLDPVQESIRKQYLLMGIQYIYKSGDKILDPSSGFDIDEALISRACLVDLEYCVQVTREVGLIWHDVKKPPYTTLFNTKVNLILMWNAVKIRRIVKTLLKEKIAENLTNKTLHLICQSGENFILHKVYQYIDKSVLKNNENYIPKKQKISKSVHGARRTVHLKSGNHDF